MRMMASAQSNKNANYTVSSKRPEARNGRAVALPAVILSPPTSPDADLQQTSGRWPGRHRGRITGDRRVVVSS
jgi:hypothetical protein